MFHLAITATLMAFAFYGPSPTAAGDPAVQAANVTMQEGIVVSAEQNKLVIADKQKAQHSYTVDNGVPVQVNGKQGKLEDLKKTMLVTVTVSKEGKVMRVATVDLMKKLADSRHYWR